MTQPHVQHLNYRTWPKGLRQKIAGTSQWVDVVPGLYLYDTDVFGIYYSSNGTSYLCNIHKAKELANEDEVTLILCYAGRHTGAVYNVNLR